MLLASLALFLALTPARAQVTPAQSYEPVNDTPEIKLGTVIYADYAYASEPSVTDAQGQQVKQNQFEVTRAYINVFGNISHLISFRVTPDIRADTNPNDPSLFGSYVFRVKYAFGQFNFDEWAGKGAWIRFGITQTPYIDYTENIYRYRFLGPIFEDREGYLVSSDAGISAHYSIPYDFGDIMVGGYNGEGYANLSDSVGRDAEKAFQSRLSIRPFPNIDIIKGLRITGFYDYDHVVKDAAKFRTVASVTFENQWCNAGYDYLWADDQPTAGAPVKKGQGYTVWVNPRTPFGLELFGRYDLLHPNTTANNSTTKRTIAALSYWFPVVKTVSTALAFQFEEDRFNDYNPAKPRTEKYGLYSLFQF
jgi:hypothetical protein